MRVLSNTAWMVFDKVFVLFINLLVTLKVANHYGSGDYGAYQYAVSIVAIIEVVVTLVDGRVLKKLYLNNDGDAVVYTATISRVIFSCISLVIGCVLLLFLDTDSRFKVLFVILLLNAILTNLRFGMANRFEYLLKSKKVVVAADLSLLIGGVLQLIAVGKNLSVVSISVITVISSAINLFIIFTQYHYEFAVANEKTDKAAVKFDRNLLRIMVKESVPLAIAASCATIYTKCDSVMVGAMMTTAEVGVYAIAAKLISVIEIILVPIRESVYPSFVRLYHEDKIRYERLYIEITSILTWIYIGEVVFSFLILPYVFKFLNDEYMLALPIYQIYVFSAFFTYNAGLRAGHFTLINKGKILAYSQFAAVIINIIFNYIGITLWGVYGAAIATVITQGLSLSVSNLFFKEGKTVFYWQMKAINPLYVMAGVKRILLSRRTDLKNKM